MFTGLIQTLGEVTVPMRKNGGEFRVKCANGFEDAVRGESVAVNGVCLTLESASGGELSFHVLGETAAKSNLPEMDRGDFLNIERALRAGDRIGGHFVTGHIDFTAKIDGTGFAGADRTLTVLFPEDYAGHFVCKGSVAIDGISLTIVLIGDSSLKVHIIPETWKATALRYRNSGDRVNIETDMLGKYVLKTIAGTSGKRGIGIDELRNAGWGV